MNNKDTVYDKTLTVKVTLQQWENITNYATDRKTDVSSILREFIDNLTTEEGHLDAIEYFNYRIKKHQAEIEKLKKSKQDKQKKVSPKEYLEERRALSMRFQETIFTPITTMMGDKLIINKSFEENRAGLEEALPMFIELIENENDEEIKKIFYGILVSGLNFRYGSKYTVDDVLQRITSS